MSLKHPAEDLWDRHNPATPYPAGVEPVPEPMRGLAFFPGGFGLWRVDGQPLPTFPVRGVMVLGHDFHSREGYDRSRAQGGESEKMPTWRNLIRLFGEVGIPLESCFFTNFYMGLRSGTATTGPFPGIDDFSTTVVALIHPSLRHASLRHRKYGTLEGAAAELAMLREGIAISRAVGQRARD